MTAEKKGASASAVQAVTVHLAAEKILDREPVLLFTASQVEEVLPDITVQPLPFSADHLLGLCAWRDQILPVIDVAQLYGLQTTRSDGGMRYLVVRSVGAAVTENNEAGKTEIFRCALKVSDQIVTGDLPAGCIGVDAEGTDFAPALVRGIFEREGELIIVPDLLLVICSDTLSQGESPSE
jgi:chemotaxis signal transduction protein